VISKTTASIYKDQDISLPDMASELNADAVVEPTVMCYGDSVCIQIRVITPFPEEQQIWIGEYKEEKSKIMSLYNRVTKQIADEVKIQLTPGEEQLLAEARTINSEAYDYYLKGLYYWDQFTGESIQLALEYFTRAIEIDPDWALPYAGVAYYWAAIRQYGFAPPSITIPRIYENLEKAARLDPNSAFVQYVSALISVWVEYNWENGETEFLNVLEINPNDALSHAYYAHLLACLKRDEEARQQTNIAMDLDPMNPMVLGLSSMALAFTGEYEKAIEVGEHALSLAPGNGAALAGLYIAYLLKEDYNKAFDPWTRSLAIDKQICQEIQVVYEKEGFPAAASKLAEAYLNTGHVIPFDLAMVYAAAGNSSLAMDWMEKDYEDKDASIPYVGTNLFSEEPFKIDDPRLLELLDKMNLPHPADQ
jgi:tetratricopeptide (TPR) repeat protein